MLTSYFKKLKMKKTLLLILIYMSFTGIAHASTNLTIYPNNAGNETQLTPVNCTYNYQCVDDTVIDNDSTYNRTNSVNFVHDLYNLGNTTASGTINYLDTYVAVRCESNSACTVRTRLMTNNNTFNGSDNIPPSASYSLYSTHYKNNPETIASWTWADLNSLQAGADMQGWNGGDQAGYRCRLTQVYVIANYTKNATSSATTTMIQLTTGDIEKIAINATTTQIGAGLDGTKYITQSVIQVNFLLVIYFFFVIFIIISVIFFFLNKLKLNKK